MREFNYWETAWITELTQSQILPNCRSHSHSQWDLHQDPARPLVHHTSPFQKRQTTTIIGFVWHVRCRQVSRVKVQPTHVFSLLIIFTCKLLNLHYFDSWNNALYCIGGYTKEPKSVTAFDLFTNFTCKFNPMRSQLETVLDLWFVYVCTKDMGLLVVNGTNINIQ